MEMDIFAPSDMASPFIINHVYAFPTFEMVEEIMDKF